MPQTKRKSAAEILGLAPRRPAAEILGLLPQAPPPPPVETQSIGSAFFTPFAFAGANIANFAEDLYNRTGQTLERVGRGGLEFISAFDPTGAAYEPTVQSQQTRLAQLEAEAQPLRSDFGSTISKGVAKREAMQRSTAGKIANVAGTILSAPINVTPENTIANIATIPFAGAGGKVVGQAFRAGISAIGRRFGAGAAQIIEAEAKPAAIAQVIPEDIPFTPKLRTEIQAARAPAEPGVPETFTPSAQIRQKRGQLMPEQGTAGREVRPNPTLYDPLEAGGFYEEPAQAASTTAAETAAKPAAQLTKREKIVNFLDQQENAARARIQARRNPNVLRDISTVVPDVVDYSIIGAAKIGKGAIKYEQFAEEMISEYGEELRPRIRQIYDESKKYYQYQIGLSDKQLEKLTAPPSVTAAVSQATENVPTPILTRAKNELFVALGALKSLKASLDISAPFRQGALLMLPPNRWGQLAKTWGNMFRAFRSKDF